MIILDYSFQDMTDLRIWAEKKIEEIYRQYKENFPTWKYGIKVFYGPVKELPNLIIIGYPPGGNVDEDGSRFEQGDFSISSESEYLSKNYHLARAIRRILSVDLIRSSVGLNWLFFRAPSEAVWNQESGHMRKEMEYLCTEQLKMIIKEIRPKTILILGMKTYKELKIRLLKMPFLISDENIILKNRQRLLVRAQMGSIPIFAIAHPTGARIRRKNIDLIRKILSKEI